MLKISKQTKFLIVFMTITCLVACLGVYVVDKTTKNKISQMQQLIDGQQKQIGDLMVTEEALQDKLEVKEKQLDQLKKENSQLEKMIQNMNRKVSYNSADITEGSNTTAFQLKKALKGTKLEDLAPSLYKAEKLYKINAFVLAGILAHESGWGTKINYNNNLSGFAIYNRGGGKTFDSKEDNVIATAKLLAENYVKSGQKNFHGKSLEAVNTDYCLKDNGNTDWHWSEDINNIAKQLIDKANK